MRPAERLLKKTESTDHPILFHSDQGVQYSSAGYCNLLSQYNVIQSMSRAGNPYDNAVMESFWGRFKDSLRCHFHYWERDNLSAVVADAFHYFNSVRPLRKLSQDLRLSRRHGGALEGHNTDNTPKGAPKRSANCIAFSGNP